VAAAALLSMPLHRIGNILASVWVLVLGEIDLLQVVDDFAVEVGGVYF
jgi:hypothetical protein